MRKSTKNETVFILLTLLVLFLYGCKCEKEVQEDIITSKEISVSTDIQNNQTEENKIADNSLIVDVETDSVITQEKRDIILGFAGDINLDENWSTTIHLQEKNNDIEQCIDKEILDDLRNCNLFMLNNEYTYSDRGMPFAGKTYTFRANRSRVNILEKMGVDIVLLANNHIYDYGEDAMLDTLDILNTSNIDYVGAGRNIEEACKIVYYDMEEGRIAYVAASRAEKNRMTPQATQDAPGILLAYDSEKIISLVQEAAKNSDFVVANVHWGTEYSFDLEPVQKELGHALVDAGADIVIGTHPHVLQGIELYKNTPIFYSLGNFWFNEKDLYSGYVKATIDPTDFLIRELIFVPCVQQNCETRQPKDLPEKVEILSFIENMSENLIISENGIIQKR